MNRLDGFNRIASYYDALKRAVFGSAIGKSQLCFLDTLPRSGNFLILGGGSGEILKALLSDRPDARVWYVEASSEMLLRARRRLLSGEAGRVEFVHGTQDSIPPDLKFDTVITQFFLDLFPSAELARVCQKVNSQLNDEGLWLVSDFVDEGKRWQRLLLWLMYRFFRLVSRINADKLPDWQQHLHDFGFERYGSRRFYNGFILSAIYKRSPGKFD